jgi:beta-glucuronidase
VPDTLLLAKANNLVVKVDNKRAADEVPTLNTDWWNYGGITRTVQLVQVPARQAILDYSLQLAPHSRRELAGWVKLSEAGGTVTVSVPELHLLKTFSANQSNIPVNLDLAGVRLWSPRDPKTYEVVLTTPHDTIREKIGFRSIEVDGSRLLLNGEPVFLRGISIHGEMPTQGRRAVGPADARTLLGWAKELGCNMVRLAHYPHDESMTRLADSLGLLVWSEIPVYWTIDFTSNLVLQKAQKQLQEMIARDRNRASIIIWSVGNETPVTEARTRFMHTLLETARAADASRLVSAALEVNYQSAQNLRVIDDPLGQYVDVVAFNQYLGWYGGTPLSCRTAQWSTPYKKPIFISETGAEALGGFHRDSTVLWSEEYQAWYYREQVAMLHRMPEGFVGISPWILADFRSPRRNNPVYQQGWNSKGLIDRKGHKKLAFYVLRSYYQELKQTHP